MKGKKTQISFTIDKELHKELKRYVLEHDTNIKEFLLNYIEKTVKGNSK